MATGNRGRWATAVSGGGFVLLAAAAGCSAWAARCREIPAGATVTDAEVTQMVSERHEPLIGQARIDWRTSFRFTDADSTRREGSDLVPVGRTDVDPGKVVSAWYTTGAGGRSGLLCGVDRSNHPWDVWTLTLTAAAAAAGGLFVGLLGRRLAHIPDSEA